GAERHGSLANAGKEGKDSTRLRTAVSLKSLSFRFLWALHSCWSALIRATGREILLRPAGSKKPPVSNKAAVAARSIGAKCMNSSSTFTLKDGTQIYYKDWGTGQPVVFHHGWPLSADDWDAQMLFFLSKGYRVIAHDRRGHGRSSQTDTGNDMDTYVDDVKQLAK